MRPLYRNGQPGAGVPGGATRYLTFSAPSTRALAACRATRSAPDWPVAPSSDPTSRAMTTP